MTTPPDPPPVRPPESTERLTELFHRHAARVYAFARRHVEDAHCDDVVSETFLVAWRRPEQIPPEPLPWLLVVARNVIRNHRRTSHRADQVWFAAVREGWTAATPSAHDTVAERETVLAALAGCTRAEREALLLTAWDGLTPVEAALVADCSVRAFTVRLHRARTRLRAAYSAAEDHQPSVPAGEPARRTRLVQELS